MGTSRADGVRAIERQDGLRPLTITEPRYIGLYGDRTRLTTVSDISDHRAVCTAAVKASPDTRAFDGVVPLSERAVLPAAYVRSTLGIQGMSFDEALAFTNKHAMKLRLAEGGIPVAAFALALRPKHVLAAAQSVGWPVIVKPVMSSGGSSAIVIRSEEEMRREGPGTASEMMRRLTAPRSPSDRTFPVVVEHFCDVEREIHCEGVVGGGKVRFFRAAHYFGPVLDGIGQIFGSLPVDPATEEWGEMETLHQQVVDCMRLRNGVTHLELIKTPGGLLVGEIACRPPGAGIVRHIELSDGVDLWREHIRASMGMALDVRPRPRDYVVAECSLPARLGRVLDVTPAERYWEIPETVDVMTMVEPGTEVRGVIDSSRKAAVVYLRVDDEGELPRLVEEVSRRFQLSVTDP